MQVEVTFDSDVVEIIHTRMSEQGVSFNEAVNAIIRQEDRPRFRTETASMGEPSVDMTQALSLAGEIEDILRIRQIAQE